MSRQFVPARAGRAKAAASPVRHRGHDPLDGIDLVIFDKDGTLIDFQSMWSAWVRTLADDLERVTGLTLTDPLFELLGVDRERGVVRSHGLLAATPMARIREHVVALVVARGLPARAAEAAVASAWHPPDPVELARPVTDLRALLSTLRASGRRLAVATSDDRVPTERTLAGLGIADLFDELACADDGGPVKPSPSAVLRLCASLGVAPASAAVVGDSPADLAMGRAAGAGRVIGVLTGVAERSTLEPLADLVMASIAGLVPG
jgi:phosphoglycolate phosphatase-like HAD superfamily hydrolase